MTTSSSLALGTASFSSSVPSGLPFAFLAKGWFWVSLLVALVVADLQVGSWVSSSSSDAPTGAPAHSSRCAVEGSWQNFHDDVSPRLAAPSERIIP
jgi:hypothetical protein